ncbi:MAG: stage III sporulation protein AB [Lachnospiraceae bacterium]|jgi:stage III sporulation protein AB|nr:stage III sporulation protein AB [Lachnospiraceae bacterium]
MLRGLGVILVMLGCTLAGWYKVWQMRANVSELCLIQRQLIMFIGEISSGCVVLSEVMERLKRNSKGHWSKFYEEICSQMDGRKEKSFEGIWNNATDKFLKHRGLSKEELEIWQEFGTHIGYLDKEMQITLAKLCKERMEQWYALRKEQLAKTAKMYQSFGITGGLFLVIVLW